MGGDNRVSSGPSRAKSRDIPKLVLDPIGRILRTGDPAATIDRVFTSQHLDDLRLIIAFAFVAVGLLFGIGVVVLIVPILSFLWSHSANWGLVSGYWMLFTPALGVFGAVLAWAYQAGSQRLGVVDLFACEIGTLCRVVGLVDAVGRSIEIFQRGSPGRSIAAKSESQSRHFTSEENYFPVFENNTRDLQSLEAHVVINITAFYTYMKAVRDSTRSLMDMSTPPDQAELGSFKAPICTPWQEAARYVIYMMFLALESARKAITDLVEFEPDQAEQTIVTLISELEAYAFLREQFTDENDIHCLRLELREADYNKLIPNVRDLVQAGKASNKACEWEPASRLVPELNRRYQAIMNLSSCPERYASTA